MTMLRINRNYERNTKILPRKEGQMEREKKREEFALSNNINMLYLFKMSFIILERYNSCISATIISSIFLRMRLMYAFSFGCRFCT